MQIVDLIGDRMFLDYLITQNFNFNYNSDQVNCSYSSYCFIDDIDNKIIELTTRLNSLRESTEINSNDITDYEAAISVLNTLKINLNK
jgi:hypothetical protein